MRKLNKLIFSSFCLLLISMSCQKETIIDPEVSTRAITYYDTYISGSARVTEGSQEVYTLQDVPPYYTVEWFCINDGTIVESDKKQVTIKFDKGSGTKLITATIHDHNSNYTYSASLKVEVHPGSWPGWDYSKYKIVGPDEICRDLYTRYSLNESLPEGIKILWRKNSDEIDMPYPTFGTVTLRRKLKSSGKFVLSAELSDSKSGRRIQTLKKDIVICDPPKIVGPDLICDCETPTFSLLNVPDGATITWELPSCKRIISGQGTSSVTYEVDFSSIFGYSQEVIATITIGNNYIFTKNVHVGTPEIEYVDYDDPVVNEMFLAEAVCTAADSYRWELVYGRCQLDITRNPWIAGVVPFNSDEIKINVIASNKCGSSTDWIQFKASR